MDSSVQLHSPSFINSKTSVLPLEPGSPPPVSSQPFQIQLAALGTADYVDSVSISSLPALQSFTSNWRHAKFTSLSLHIFPTALAVKSPTTVRVCWVPANSAAMPAQILDVHGGECFCVGGPLHANSQIIVPAPLSNLNPTAKSPVTFLDTPKLLIASYPSPSPPAAPTCYAVIKGMVEFHSPLLQSSA
uniref:Capsid protein n=1 Tax=Valeriana jatamansi tymovirus 1 TaxID=3075581 RepID=A0AA96HFT0_9VIRU|nr:coat protein [Valeriana jatamansi tymovirus 1]